MMLTGFLMEHNDVITVKETPIPDSRGIRTNGNISVTLMRSLV